MSSRPSRPESWHGFAPRRASESEPSLYDGLAGDATALKLLAPGSELVALRRLVDLMTPAGWNTTFQIGERVRRAPDRRRHAAPLASCWRRSGRAVSMPRRSRSPAGSVCCVLPTAPRRAGLGNAAG